REHAQRVAPQDRARRGRCAQLAELAEAHECCWLGALRAAMEDARAFLERDDGIDVSHGDLTRSIRSTIRGLAWRSQFRSAVRSKNTSDREGAAAFGGEVPLGTCC